MDASKIKSPTQLPTIENELRVALFKAGCIIPTNSEDLSKIGWSRSSRTDKGVHAGRIAFSAKLEIPEALLTQPNENTDENNSMNPQSFPSIISSINHHLPEDIRLFSCVRVGKGFAARSAGSWRAYEYILPLRLFRSYPPTQQLDDQSLLNRFNGFLRQLEGCQDFHNFHRMSTKEVKFRSNKRSMPLKSRRDEKSTEKNENVVVSAAVEASEPGEEVELTEDHEEEEEEEAAESTTSASEDVAESDAVIANVYDRWKEIPRRATLLTRSIIFRCRGDLITRDGEKFIRVSIIAQHFLLHQIRLMISAAFLSTTHLVPDFFISLAKLNQILYHIPLAPANGLVLVNSGFKTSKYQEMASSRMTAQHPSTALICSDKEDEAAEEFLQSKIYPQIFLDWQENNWQRMTDYIRFSEKFRVPQHLVEEWANVHSRLAKQSKEELEIKFQKDVRRVQKSLEKVRSSYSEEKVQKQRYEFVPKDFLPSTLSTALAIHYQITPGYLTSSMMKALATKMINDELAADSSVQDIIKYLEETAHLVAKPFDHKNYTIYNEANVEMLSTWLRTQTIHPLLLNSADDSD